MILNAKISGLAILLVIICSEPSFSQQARITGVISDTASLPVESVTISISGTIYGTYSNKKGEYSINIPNPGKEYNVIFSLSLIHISEPTRPY